MMATRVRKGCSFLEEESTTKSDDARVDLSPAPLIAYSTQR